MLRLTLLSATVVVNYLFFEVNMSKCNITKIV